MPAFCLLVDLVLHILSVAIAKTTIRISSLYSGIQRNPLFFCKRSCICMSSSLPTPVNLHRNTWSINEKHIWTCLYIARGFQVLFTWSGFLQFRWKYCLHLLYRILIRKMAYLVVMPCIWKFEPVFILEKRKSCDFLKYTTVYRGQVLKDEKVCTMTFC